MRHTTPHRLALYVPDLAGGGAERVMVNLANAFCRMGHRVDLVLATVGGVNTQFVSERVTLVPLRARGCLTSIPSLVAFLRKARPDGLFSTIAHANLAALIASRLAHIRIKVIVREANSIKLTLDNARSLPARAIPTCMRFLYQYADVVLANSAGLASELVQYLKLPAQKVRVSCNPVVTDDFDRLADEDTTDQWVNDSAVPLVLAVGRLTAVKDFATLVRAFRIVCNARPARLIICGDGEEKERLSKLITEEHVQTSVRLVGYVNNPYPFMRNCSCFVLSSRSEGCPNALIQALLLGARVISTDCPWGPSEVLERGALGRLVPVGDASQMAAAILGTIEKPQAPLPPKTLVELRQKYSADTVAEKLLELVEN